jgi:NDP-sugar pyrophosphorylase family protein
MLDAHADPGIDVALTVATRRYFHNVPFGSVMVDDANRIVEVEEKPTISMLINAGMYVVSPRLLSQIPHDCPFSMPSLIEDCLSRGDVVRSYEVADDWIDVGQKEQLRQARGELP